VPPSTEIGRARVSVGSPACCDFKWCPAPFSRRFHDVAVRNVRGGLDWYSCLSVALPDFHMTLFSSTKDKKAALKKAMELRAATGLDYIVADGQI